MDLIETIKSRPVIGTWITSNSNKVLDSICSSGIDFAILDNEHGSISSTDLESLVITCKSRKVTSIFRPSNNDLGKIQHALDAGCNGIQVPNVESKKMAEDVVRNVKYPPIGNRGFSPFVPVGNYDKDNSQSIIDKGINNTIICINIEGADGIKDFKNIIKTQFIDIAFIGVFDITKMLGIPGQIENEKVKNILKECAHVAKEEGKFIGTIATSLNQAKEYIDLGMKYIVYSVDMYEIKKVYSSVIDVLNK